MPFGISTASSIFQKLTNVVLEGCEFATAYIDDILIFSKTEEEHLEHIQVVLDRLRTHGLKLKLKKCAFFQAETEYLGVMVSKDGVKMNPGKVEAIRKVPQPTTVKQVRCYMALTSYYRKFIPNFSEIAQPLINLTRKHARFKWSRECQLAFDFLKASLTVIPLFLTLIQTYLTSYTPIVVIFASVLV